MNGKKHSPQRTQRAQRKAKQGKVKSNIKNNHKGFTTKDTKEGKG
jgi:hypothetical protein